MKLFSSLIYMVLTSSMALAQTTGTWNTLDRDTQADILKELDYLTEKDLPDGTEILNLADWQTKDFDISKIENETYRNYVIGIIDVFDDQVSREQIEQSPFSAYGDPKLSNLQLLLDSKGEVLGASLGFYQDGRDEEGEAGDINWQAHVIFDGKGKIFSNDNGEPYNDLYYEWSGH